MPVLVIQHPVLDFQVWKAAFDSDPVGRAQNGVTRHAIYRPADDPRYVVIELQFDTREAAQAFLDHPKLRAAWQSFGAQNVGTRIFDEVERVVY